MQAILDVSVKEPLDVKRLQAKNLHDYLKDIILAEKVTMPSKGIGTKGRRIQVDFVLDSNKEWLHVAEVMKRCQRCSSPTDQQAHTPPKTREVLSNALHPGPVDKEHKIAYATKKIASFFENLGSLVLKRVDYLQIHNNARGCGHVQVQHGGCQQRTRR